MRELQVGFEAEADVHIAGTLCLPEGTSPQRPTGGIVLLGGTFGDTRDGNMLILETLMSSLLGPATQCMSRAVWASA